MNIGPVRRTGTLAAAAAIVLGSASAASASTWSHSDARHDVKGFSLAQLDPSGDFRAAGTGLPLTAKPRVGSIDVTRVSVRNGDQNLVVRLRTRGDLPTNGLDADFMIKTPKARYEVDRMDMPGMQMTMSLSDVKGPVTCAPLAVSVRPYQHTVTLTVPRYCIGKPRWVRVGAGLTTFKHKTLLMDDALHRGIDAKNHLSPRVHVG